MNTKLTITLSGRRPIEITKSAWPLIARSDWFSGQLACQANEEAYIKVRQHQDGRTLVYCSRDRGPGGMAIGYRGSQGGFLLEPGQDPVQAIRDCAGIIQDYTMGDECIADLPAESVN
jgi:hypothetical protein